MDRRQFEDAEQFPENSYSLPVPSPSGTCPEDQPSAPTRPTYGPHYARPSPQALPPNIQSIYTSSQQQQQFQSLQSYYPTQPSVQVQSYEPIMMSRFPQSQNFPPQPAGSYPSQPSNFSSQPSNNYASQPNMIPTQSNMIPTQPNNYSSQPSNYTSRPNMIATQPNMIPTQPNMIPTQPNMIPTQPNMIPTQPNNYSSQPNNYSSQPNNYSSQPNNYSSQPNNYSSQPSNYSSQPSNYASQPSNYASRPTNYYSVPGMIPQTTNNYFSQMTGIQQQTPQNYQNPLFSQTYEMSKFSVHQSKDAGLSSATTQEFTTMIDEIVEELKKDSKVVDEFRFILNDTFSHEELAPLKDVRALMDKMVEKKIVSETNLDSLETYLKISHKKLIKKLDRFRESRDSARKLAKAQQKQAPASQNQKESSQPGSHQVPAPHTSYALPAMSQEFVPQEFMPSAPQEFMSSFSLGFMPNTHESEQPVQTEEDRTFVYPMNKSPHGICAIFNNQNFTSEHLGQRKGSEIDGDRLKDLFTKLNYNVYVYDDLPADNMENEMKKLSETDHSDYDSFICCILTHGADNDMLYGADGNQLKLRDVMSNFYAKSCKTLFGKPKIFFIQACRGEMEDMGFTSESLGEEPKLVSDKPEYYDNAEDLPDTADFLIAFPTSSGYVSWRSHNEGTWYIKALCDKISEFHNLHDLLTILTMVNGDVAEKKTSEGQKQMPAPVTHLRKLVNIRS